MLKIILFSILFVAELHAVKCDVPTCTNEGAWRCSVCKTVRYCGKDHQRMSWGTHKNECKKFAASPILEPESKTADANKVACELVPFGPYTKEKILDFASQIVNLHHDSNIKNAFKMLPECHRIVIGLAYINEDKQQFFIFHEWLSRLVLAANELTITISAEIIISKFERFGVIQLRHPQSDTLVIGCGHSKECRRDHSDYDTLDSDLKRNPTVVADWSIWLTGKFFEDLTKQYDRILDEGPIVLWCKADKYLMTAERVLKKEGTITVPNYREIGKEWQEEDEFKGSFIQNSCFMPVVTTYAYQPNYAWGFKRSDL